MMVMSGVDGKLTLLLLPASIPETVSRSPLLRCLSILSECPPISHVRGNISARLFSVNAIQ